MLQICEKCNGKGIEGNASCETCLGKGLIEEEKVKEIELHDLISIFDAAISTQIIWGGATQENFLLSRCEAFLNKFPHLQMDKEILAMLVRVNVEDAFKKLKRDINVQIR